MGKNKKDKEVIYFCDGKKCGRCNEEPKTLLENLLQSSDCGVSLKKMKCQGLCKKAPVFYLPASKKYKKRVDIAKATKMAEQIIA